jgi:2-polyprenyl-6-methoxyphenol hydroxylase-like FAD-dependent oxidoreductase
MPRITDVFIVGGGPSGLAAAIAARRRGLDVTVADVARPPIDKACGEGIMPDGIAAAQAIGVTLDGAAAHPFRGIRFRDGERTAEAFFPHGCGLGLRRTVLHTILLEAASAAGVRLVWGERISALEDLPARWIIGADGGDSRVRQWAGLDSRRHDSQRFGFRRHYATAPWSDFVEIVWGDRFELYLTPVAPREMCVALICSDPRLRLDDAVMRFPDLARRLGQPIGPIRGGVTASRQLRAVCRGRVALIGDASGSVDAIAGDGLCLAFRQAEALAGALEAGDLSLYAAAHRRLARRPRLMSNLLLMLDRSSCLRHVTVRAFAEYPKWFARVLAMHVEEREWRDARAVA